MLDNNCKSMKWHVAVCILAASLSACQAPQGDQGVSSSGQQGGVTANTVGTVNQSIAPRIKSPYLNKLQQLFVEGAQLNRQWQSVSSETTDSDIDVLSVKSANWVNTNYSWISAHITPAAAERFVQVSSSAMSFTIGGNHHRANINSILTNWMNNMPQYVANLDALMRSDEMYPQ